MAELNEIKISFDEEQMNELREISRKLDVLIEQGNGGLSASSVSGATTIRSYDLKNGLLVETKEDEQ
jgi:hypothetical protein